MARARRLPGAIELPWARRRRLRAERPTVLLAAAAAATTAVVAVTEIARVVRRSPQRLTPGEAVSQAVEVAVEGHRGASPAETRLLNLLGSFTLTFGFVRTSTWMIRRRGQFGPFRNLKVGQRHVHHFVPGIALALLAGGASVLTDDEALEEWLAVPFGIGTALTLDESALLLMLDDVYWTEEGIVSVQISLVALLMLSGAALALRALRRGELEVLPDPADLDAPSVQPTLF
ncbi:MAG: hypothetical protein JWP17_3962 [Solirubrobacterales bacterium]|jgi:hypothetical protein|nr:hypothetical protein [Solirubrobacterales bacterium]